jgi:hypothetical protein
MRTLIHSTILLCYLIGVAAGRIFFRRSYYKAFLILIYLRDYFMARFHGRSRAPLLR